MNSNLKNIVFVLTVIANFSTTTFATLTPPDKVKNKSKELKMKTDLQMQNVFHRNLVEEEPSPKDILIEHAAFYKDTSTKLFNGTVLGYVTPWNAQGYDVAQIWKNKFDIISPVWLQILPKSDNSNYTLAGTHDVDVNWLKDLKRARTKIFPRVIFDQFAEKDVNWLLYKSADRLEISKLLIKACSDYKFDGYVLEVWSQFSPHFDDQLLVKLVIDISNSLSQKGYSLILVIPPRRERMPDLFSSKHFEQLHSYVYLFSLMTYDFSSIERPGANAPLYWMEEAVEHIVPEYVDAYRAKRSKILMGLNMYGNDYTPDGGTPIIGHQFLDLLKHAKRRLIHDERDTENFFEVKTISGRHIVFYPTLFSINERIKLARELGVGLSIWELGQGLLYFYDLF